MCGKTLKLKKSLFAGVFDSPTGEVSFAALGRKSMMQAIKEIFANQPGRPKPLINRDAHKALPVQSIAGPIAPSGSQVAGATAASQSTGFEQAAAGLIVTGVRFLESLAAVAQNSPADGTLANLVSLDPRTNRPVLSIPLPESVDRDRLVGAFTSLSRAFGRSA